MKKFLLSAFALAVAFSASAFNLATTAKSAQLGAPMNAKQAPKELIVKMAEKAIANNASNVIKLNNPVTKASDFEGGYDWTYEMANDWGVDPDTVETTGTYTDPVVMYGADDEAGTFKIAGMFDAPITATIDTETYASYGYVGFDLSDEELASYTSNYGTCYIKGVFYYEDEEDDENSGWYYTSVGGLTNGEFIVLFSNVWFFREIASGTYAGYYLTPLWKPGSEFEVNDTNNGVMTYDYNSFTWGAAMGISESEDYVITINNWAGLSDNPVTIYMGYNNVWVADTVTLFSNSNGAYVLYGLDGNSIGYLEGTGTATTLTTNTEWTGYDEETGYWLGRRGVATITLVGSEFVWPVEATTPDVYILGEVGENTWATNVGQQMTLDEESGLYTAEIVCDGRNDGYNFFKFSTKLLEAADDWDGIAPYMFGAVSDGDFLVTDEMLGIDLSLTNENGQAYKIPAGTYDLTLNYADMKLMIAKLATPITLGDANEDGEVNVNDVTTIINYILQKNPTPFNFDNADVNGDGEVNVMDVTTIINMILGVN
ncbi:MAG: dockerin type I repeat-containing protein [Muribaculaceae bacterium]|nr:dockerin type I repeat-containing protein [Muribaculaceae bacterium]